MLKTPKTLKTLTLLAGVSLLAACQTTGSSDSSYSEDRLDAALRAAANGSTDQVQSLGYVEKLYKRNSQDPEIAVQYAKSLRHSDYFDRAAAVLGPFAMAPDASTDVYAEFSAIQLAMGRYQAAEDYAQKAALADDGNGQAYHYLGIALDARGMHEAAERAYNKALGNWKGDPTTLMNNLALNLTTQNRVKEAIELLYKAQSIAPNRIEIERNLRIAIALLQSQNGKAPKPVNKPMASKELTPPPKAPVAPVESEQQS